MKNKPAVKKSSKPAAKCIPQKPDEMSSQIQGSQDKLRIDWLEKVSRKKEVTFYHPEGSMTVREAIDAKMGKSEPESAESQKSQPE